jgi:hypothetical protein
MATIKYEIDLLRSDIREITDDSKYPDQELYGRWNTVRNQILSQQIETMRRVNEFNRERFCFELEEGYSHDCGCIEIGCEVLVSKHPIPESIDVLQILTLSGKPIGYSSESEYRTLSDDRILSQNPRYGIYSRKVFIYNPGSLGILKPAVLQANGVWADPTEWVNKQYCDESTTSCKKVDEMSAGLSPKYSSLVRRIVLQDMFPSFQIPEDKTADYDNK